jgi:hypothetical protein
MQAREVYLHTASALDHTRHMTPIGQTRKVPCTNRQALRERVVQQHSLRRGWESDFQDVLVQ